MYEVLLNLTPGIKWNIGKQWMLAVQGIVPLYNDYGDRYKRIRLNMAVLSKEWDWNQKQFVKISGGLFGEERYGLDIKWMYPVNRWLAVDAQLGLTGFCSMAVDWECSKMQRVSGQAGMNIYLEKVNTEFRLHGGRYLYEDYGVIAEAMRHFRHCTVGVYAQYSNKGKENGGFKVVMIPPYKRKAHKVMVRPASNFRLTYNIQALPYAVKTYTTDPEENEREGNFDRQRLQWGPTEWNRILGPRKEATDEKVYSSVCNLPDDVYRGDKYASGTTIYKYERTDSCAVGRYGSGRGSTYRSTLPEQRVYA